MVSLYFSLFIDVPREETYVVRVRAGLAFRERERKEGLHVFLVEDSMDLAARSFLRARVFTPPALHTSHKKCNLPCCARPPLAAGFASLSERRRDGACLPAGNPSAT